jgi:sulfur transfer protein SufE
MYTHTNNTLTHTDIQTFLNAFGANLSENKSQSVNEIIKVIKSIASKKRKNM